MSTDYSDDERLQRYINKMLQLQNEQRDKPLTEQELKDIALEIGMSEEDLKASEEAYLAHLKSGQGHLKHGNWKDAIYELEQASALKPNSLEATHSLSQAYKERWSEKKDPKDQATAEKYAQRALQIQPGHAASLSVLSNLRRTEKELEVQKSSKKIFLGLAIGIVALLMIIFYVVESNIASQKVLLVSKKWAQVENVYQRRADLIPQLVRTTQAAAKLEKETLQDAQNAYEAVTKISIDAKKMTANELSDFQSKQAEISQALSKLLNASTNSPELRASQAFRDLQVQIEGAENRIAVERKRYNEAVAEYNAFITTFPGSLLGMKPKEFLKMDKGAEKAPEIKF